MTTAELSPENLKRHVGRRLVSTDVVTAAPANLLRLAFGRAEPEFEPGDPLPPGWHGLYFLRTTARRARRSGRAGWSRPGAT